MNEKNKSIVIYALMVIDLLVFLVYYAFFKKTFDIKATFLFGAIDATIQVVLINLLFVLIKVIIKHLAQELSCAYGL